MSRVRIWDNAFHFIAAEDDCPEPTNPLAGDDIEITIPGEGPIHDALKHHMRDGSLLDDDLHITIDQDNQRRIGGKITAIGIETRRCECRTNDITTTTITAADPRLDPQRHMRGPGTYHLPDDVDELIVHPDGESTTHRRVAGSDPSGGQANSADQPMTYPEFLTVSALCSWHIPLPEPVGPNRWLCRLAWATYQAGHTLDIDAAIAEHLPWLNTPDYHDERRALIDNIAYLRRMAAKPPLWPLPENPFNPEAWLTTEGT